MFKHYAVLDKKDMANHSVMRINLNEFTKFGFQTKLAPRAVSLEDMTSIFRAVVRERSSKITQKEKDELGIGLNSLGLEDFKKALIRIAILGQARLPEGETIDQKLIEWMNDPNSSKPSIVAIRAPKNVRVRGRSVLNSAGSSRPSPGLTKQASKSGITPYNNEVAADTSVDIGTKRQSVPARKTKEQKLLEELSKAKERQVKMGDVKIEDKKMNKSFDVSLITPSAIQSIITFLQLKQNQNAAAVETVFNHNVQETQDQQQHHDDLGDQPNEEREDLEDDNKIYGGDEEDEQQASHNNDAQGNGEIEGVDMDDLERQPDFDEEDIIGPNGEHENWKVEAD